MSPPADFVDRDEAQRDGTSSSAPRLSSGPAVRPTGPPGIDQETHLDPAAGASIMGRRTADPLVGWKMYVSRLTVSSPPDRLRHRRKDLVAVLQSSAWCRGHGRAEGVERAAERGIGNGELVLELYTSAFRDDEVGDERASEEPNAPAHAETRRRIDRRAASCDSYQEVCPNPDTPGTRPIRPWTLDLRPSTLPLVTMARWPAGRVALVRRDAGIGEAMPAGSWPMGSPRDLGARGRSVSNAVLRLGRTGVLKASPRTRERKRIRRRSSPGSSASSDGSTSSSTTPGSASSGRRRDLPGGLPGGRRDQPFGPFYAITRRALMKRGRRVHREHRPLAGSTPSRRRTPTTHQVRALGLSDAAMLDLRHEGIRIAAILPGSVATEFSDSHRGRESSWMLQPDDGRRRSSDLCATRPRDPVALDLRPAKPRRSKGRS